MLDFEALTRIDKEALRQSAWSKAMRDPISEFLSDHPPSLDEWFRYGDDYEKHLREQIKTSPHMQKLFGQRAALLGKKGLITDPQQCLEELGLPFDKMPTKEELKARYFTLVKQHHPDINPGNAEAVEKFKRVQTAYENTAAIYEHVEREAAAQETSIRTHFASHGASKGWHNGLSSTGEPTASFPVDHLAKEQKEALAHALRSEGYRVEEHFAADIGSNVISVSGAFEGRSASAEVVKKLQTRFSTGVTPAASAIHQAEKQPSSTVRFENNAGSLHGPTETKRLEGTAAKTGHSESRAAEPLKNKSWSEKATKTGASESKVADTLKAAAKSEEEAVAKAGGKTAWIVGGIIAATIAIGAFIAHNRKTAAARERERQQNRTEDLSID